MSVLGHLLNGRPGVMQGLELPFHSPTPGVLVPPSLAPPFWCPVKGSAGDVSGLSSHHMTDPFPSPSHDDGVHALLVVAGEKLLVGYGLRLEYT